MTWVSVPKWGFSIHHADYYGWLVAIHIGPLLIFWWPLGDTYGEAD